VWTILFMWLAGHVSAVNACIITSTYGHREMNCSQDVQANIGITWFIKEDGYAADR
jgi:hypothetical protein